MTGQTMAEELAQLVWHHFELTPGLVEQPRRPTCRHRCQLDLGAALVKMAASDVIEVLGLLDARGIAVWLNGGWGVDALLAHQTREHDDLDITIPATDHQAYVDLMDALGFTTFRVDNDFNWVLMDHHGRLVDVHLVDFSETRQSDQGATIYGPAGLPFEVGSLEGRGEISGREVRCETADFQVRGHTNYPPDEHDYLDVLALCRAFSIEMPELFTSMGFE